MKTAMLHTVLALLLMTAAARADAQPAQSADPGPKTAAQDDPPARGRAGRGVEAGLSPVEVINMLDAYAVLQAQNALQLSDEQYGQFITRLRRLHQTRRQAQQERHRLVQQLRRLAGPQVTQTDENAIRTTIKGLRDLDERSSAEIRKAYDAVDEVLDARQQARFRIFEERLEARKLDLLMRARQGAAAPKR